MTRLHELAAAGTSPWLDNIRRSWLNSGRFREWVDEGVVGVTSNPTIFQKAIAGSDDYDEALAAAAAPGKDAGDVFFELAIADVQEAADPLRGVYDSTTLAMVLTSTGVPLVDFTTVFSMSFMLRR